MKHIFKNRRDSNNWTKKKKHNQVSSGFNVLCAVISQTTGCFMHPFLTTSKLQLLFLY